MADQAGEAVEPHHHQSFVRADIVQETGKDRPVRVRAKSVLFEYGGTAGRAELVALWIG